MSFLLHPPPKPDCEGVLLAFRGCEQGQCEQAPKDVQAAPLVGEPLTEPSCSAAVPHLLDPAQTREWTSSPSCAENLETTS
jgi:hypothetical protein